MLAPEPSFTRQDHAMLFIESEHGFRLIQISKPHSCWQRLVQEGSGGESTFPIGQVSWRDTSLCFGSSICIDEIMISATTMYFFLHFLTSPGFVVKAGSLLFGVATFPAEYIF